MVNFRNLSKLAGKAKNLAGQHNDKIDQAIDKSVKAADKATKGKYGDKLTAKAEKLKGAVDKVSDKPATETSTGSKPTTPAAAAPGDAPVPDPDAPKAAN
ncbi:antitoxin [Patulibacter sp. NPDC049589]|uniref:antitoxin n=1 Tax=Patulibacter sp. NPDC049589 TaxID=3154731 RepID=UPI0034467D1D